MPEENSLESALPEVASLNFETALKQLEEIVTKLERGDVAGRPFALYPLCRYE